MINMTRSLIYPLQIVLRI